MAVMIESSHPVTVRDTRHRTRATSKDLCRALGPMVQNEELTRRQCEFRVAPSGIVGELDLIRAVQYFHHSAHLTPYKTALWQISKQCNNIQLTWSGMHKDDPYIT
jgi:hypothetical protein